MYIQSFIAPNLFWHTDIRRINFRSWSHTDRTC